MKLVTNNISKDRSEGSEKRSCLTNYFQTMMKGQKRSEIILYVVLWALLFAAPVISLYLDSWHLTGASEVASHAASGMASGAASEVASNVASGVADASQHSAARDWMGVYSAWSLLAMFCVTFFIHNFLVAPLLVYRNRKWQYAGAVAVLVVAFAAYQLWGRPHRPEPGERMEPGMEAPMNPMDKTFGEQMDKPQDSPMDKPQEGQMSKSQDDQLAPHPEMKGEHPMAQEGMGKEEKGKEEHLRDMNLEKQEARPVPPAKPKVDMMHEPPRAFGGQDSVAFIIMSLLLGLNIGTKYFFKSLDDRKRMKELERENLNSQLAYLKCQINPHFFMNTLNNIHALVDIDPEQAKYTIEVLSKLMRYVLYEGNKSMAPLQKELDFIGHYIDLMKIRYTDKVRITLSLPSSRKQLASSINLGEIQVPSLLFATFVENAFKHGVSYQKASFIEVSVRVDEVAHEVEFLCCNSKKPAAEDKKSAAGDKHGGVGLQNATKRLQLIYGKDGYRMDVKQDDEEYRLLLRMPIK